MREGQIGHRGCAREWLESKACQRVTPGPLTRGCASTALASTIAQHYTRLNGTWGAAKDATAGGYVLPNTMPSLAVLARRIPTSDFSGTSIHEELTGAFYPTS